MHPFAYIVIALGIHLASYLRAEQVQFTEVPYPGGPPIRAAQIDARQFAEACRAFPGIRVRVLRPGANLYIIAPEKAILVANGEYIAFQSERDAMRLLELNSSLRGRSLWSAKNPWGSDLKSHIPGIIEGLRIRTGARGDLTYRAMLEHVDSYVEALSNEDRIRFLDEEFLEVVVLIGQALIEDFGGTWGGRISADGNSWEPLTVIGNLEFDVAPFLWEEMQDKASNRPLRTVRQHFCREISGGARVV
jgi:hypothetical protein